MKTSFKEVIFNLLDEACSPLQSTEVSFLKCPLGYYCLQNNYNIHIHSRCSRNQCFNLNLFINHYSKNQDSIAQFLLKTVIQNKMHSEVHFF